jgi:hypothetical protein
MAGDATAWRSAVAALKQDRVEDAERQAAKDGAAVVVASGTPNTVAAPVGAVGAVGALEEGAHATSTNGVTMEPTKKSNRRRIRALLG